MIILRQKQESQNQKLSPEQEEQLDKEMLELIGNDKKLRKLYEEMKKKGNKDDNKN